MTNVQDLFTDPCCKTDPWTIDALFDLKLTPADSAELTLDNSWASTSVDLTPAVKAKETITNLLLTDTALQYNREDYGRNGAENGGIDCISGDSLSQIISMKFLKDVNQTPLTNGDIYMFNSATAQFDTFNFLNWKGEVDGTLATQSQNIASLQNGLDNLNTTVLNNAQAINNKVDNIQADLQTQITANANAITALQATVSALQSDYNTFKVNTNNRLATIEATIAKPSYVPSSAVLAWGTTNTTKNSAPSTQGIWTHNPANNVLGDTRFD